MSARRSTALEELKAQLARPASIIELGDRGPTVPGPLASWFGRVNVALPGEEWPEDGDERPMVPIAQFNLIEAPYVPPALAGLELIAVFFGQSAEPPDSANNGDGWLVRAYPSIDALVPLEAPPGALAGICTLSGSDKPITARPIRYTLLSADYPDFDELPPDVDDDLRDEWSDAAGASTGSKLGGWPSLIQGEIYWAPLNEHPANPEYAFQLGAMPKTNFYMPDDGMCYFGRGTGASRGVWTFEWQIA